VYKRKHTLYDFARFRQIPGISNVRHAFQLATAFRMSFRNQQIGSDLAFSGNEESRAGMPPMSNDQFS